MKRSRLVVAGLITVVVAITTACGSSKPSSSGSSSSSSGASASASPTDGEKLNNSGTPVTGGTLHMLGVGDVDYMDPNISYYSTGYLAARMYSRQWLTYPAEAGKTTTDVADLATQIPSTSNGGISSDGLTYKLTVKTGVMWNTSPPRQVTGADFILGLKRTCNPSQPFGGLPDYESLIVGFADFCNGFAKVDPTSASAMTAYMTANNFAGISVDPSNPLTVDYKLTTAASYFLAMLALPAFSPAPVEYNQYIPASADAGAAHHLRRSVHDPVVRPDEVDRLRAQPVMAGVD